METERKAIGLQRKRTQTVPSRIVLSLFSGKGFTAKKGVFQTSQGAKRSLASPLALVISALLRTVLVMATSYAVTQEHKTNSLLVESAFGSMLFTVDLAEGLIGASRVRKVIDRKRFVALDTSEDSLRMTSKTAFGVDTNKGFDHKVELAKIGKAQQTARVPAETTMKVLMRLFQEKMELIVIHATSQAHRISKHLRRNGDTQSSHGRSRRGETEKHKPEPTRQLGMNLDSTLTIQTRGRFLSPLPASVGNFRVRYEVVDNVWLLAQMRQPLSEKMF